MFKKLFYAMLLLSSITLVAQQRTIKGVVSDESGPLPGVTIMVKGTTNGTETDFDGRYSISANKGDVLVFSFVGMKTLEEKVKESSVINILMEADSVLEEVVVTGYGSLRGKKAFSSGVIRIRGRNQIENRDSYVGRSENIFKSPINSPLSTFSIDVDKASYSNIRRMINNGQKVPKEAVKIEEMINYFDYKYPQPKGRHPFSITTEVVSTPWNKDTQLVRIGLKGKEYKEEKLPASNLTFLIDVSGSMSEQNKLPLLKSAFKLLVNQLREKDKVAIVVYAGAAGVVLKPTSGNEKGKILEALDQLKAGGSTAGGEGIELAYKLAKENYIKDGNNRVILATDGDFNVGASSNVAMEELIEKKRKSGVFLSVLGFGYGNYQDDKLEVLADKGNGNHAYIDTM